MAYIEKIYNFKDSKEHELLFNGNYGAKGEERAPKQKKTLKEIEKQNQWKRETKVRRLIKANFEEGDFWATLKYPKGTRKEIKEIKRDFTNFINRLKRAYKKYDDELKYIYRLEIGARGGIHIHILLNRLKIPGADLVVQEEWKEGRVNFQSIYDTGGYEDLAAYIVKRPEEDSEEYRQLSLFDEKEKKVLTHYSPSKNLIQPKPEKKEYTRRTVRRIIEEGPKPAKGFYIDKNSIRQGVNRFTGKSYLYYTEIKIKRREPPG